MYRVLSRFLDRARGVYVDPGQLCPPLDEATAARLLRAGCLAPDDSRGAPWPAPTTEPPASRPPTDGSAPAAAGSSPSSVPEAPARPDARPRKRRVRPAAPAGVADADVSAPASEE